MVDSTSTRLRQLVPFCVRWRESYGPSPVPPLHPIFVQLRGLRAGVTRASANATTARHSPAIPQDWTRSNANSRRSFSRRRRAPKRSSHGGKTLRLRLAISRRNARPRGSLSGRWLRKWLHHGIGCPVICRDVYYRRRGTAPAGFSCSRPQRARLSTLQNVRGSNGVSG